MNRALVVCVCAFALASVGLGGACSDLKPGRCNSDGDCPPGTRCALDPTPQGNGRCVAKGTDGGDVGPDGDADAGLDKPGDAPSDQPEAPVACTTGSCTGAAPICDGTSKVCRACGAAAECAARNTATPVCATSGACVECSNSSQCSVASKPICEANACRACATGADCMARDPKLPACITSGPSSGTCVECTASADCKVVGKPVCNVTTNTCRACKSDSECPADPGVCMEDGHCATTGEVIFVEFNAAGCPAADGSSAKPYCAPNDGVAAITSERHVVVIRGAAGEKMTLVTTAKSPVIIGRKNSTGDVGSLPAVTSTALTISSDSVLVRDLTVGLGATAASKGIVVTGASTQVILRRVSVALVTGLGIDAESGASLTMDQCLVKDNSAGGVYINGASYNIQNSVIADNSYGVKFTLTALSSGSQFAFNTLSGNTIASTCDATNTQMLQTSIVIGVNDSCALVNCATTATPPFSATKPFHLTAHLACPAAPATVPDHDIDGDPRVAPIDCGADQYVP